MEIKKKHLLAEEDVEGTVKKRYIYICVYTCFHIYSKKNRQSSLW